jgi:hypothetical protein
VFGNRGTSSRHTITDRYSYVGHDPLGGLYLLYTTFWVFSVFPSSGDCLNNDTYSSSKLQEKYSQ